MAIFPTTTKRTAVNRLTYALHYLPQCLEVKGLHAMSRASGWWAEVQGCALATLRTLLVPRATLPKTKG